jgi:glycerol uptake facilitator-like aquaporin
MRTRTRRLLAACLLEAVCTMVFTTLWAALASGGGHGKKGPHFSPGAAAAAGAAFFACAAAALDASGGHLSPAISASLIGSGHALPGPGALYVVSQLVGGLAAALLAAATFSPRPHLAGRGDSDSGSSGGPLCLPCLGDSAGQAWAAAAWEAGATALVVFVAFAVGVARSAPSAGRRVASTTPSLAAPAALGATIAAVTAAAASAGGHAGHIVHTNPALTLASFLFACGGGAGAKAAAAHLAAEVVGAAVATAAAVWGLGLWPTGAEASEIGSGPAAQALGAAEGLLAGGGGMEAGGEAGGV